MASLKSPVDLGNVIRQRRKSLNWDQARLASESGVSRQWVVDIEKGKPRAELQLVLRVMNVLGLRLSADEPGTDRNRRMHHAPDIDAVVAAHTTSAKRTNPTATTKKRPPSKGGTVDYHQIMREVEEEFGLKSGLPAGTSASAVPVLQGKPRK